MFFVFQLSFIFSFILHPSCILSLFISSFLSVLPLDSFIYLWKKGGEYTEEYTGVFRHFYMTHVHILRGKISTSFTFIGGESHRGDAYTKGRRYFFFRKPCFTLCLFSRCFMVLWVMFTIIYALLLSLHHAYVLKMHTSLCYCALLVACSDDHLPCYMIIVVISIWLFWCMIKLLTCFTSCLLDCNLLVTLYLSFYYLLYLKGLMCFVQVFQVTSIYVPSASQLLIILKGRNFKHF